MDSSKAVSTTPNKEREKSKSSKAVVTTTPNKNQEIKRESENVNPNVSSSHSSSSPAIMKSSGKTRNKMRERKFVVVAKKKKEKKEGGAVSSNVQCKCKERVGGGNKCLCVAYENLRASQEDFFKVEKGELDDVEEIEKGGFENGEDEECGLVEDQQHKDGSTPTVKRRRDKLLEEARNSVPECGKVLHLVKAFEKLLSIPRSSNQSDDAKEDDGDQKIDSDDKKKVGKKWPLPGLPPPPKLPETMDSSSCSSFCPSDLILTAENLGLDSRASVSSSWDSSQGSISSRTSSGGRRSRRNSSESIGTMGGRRWKKKQHRRITSQKPFQLRTEQRGRHKEEEFVKKIQEMMQEEEKQRIPIAQGLPWTTDEPECLIRPPVKENTRPLDLKLHSDVRAVERAEFDHQVAEKMTLIEQYKTERERQQKMEEEEEIRRLRRELVPKAQPMPYFDRPFIPRRSVKHPTIPKEPKFHNPHQKKIKCCLSWSDVSSSYTYQH